MKYLLAIPVSIIVIALIPVGVILMLAWLVIFACTSFLSWVFGDVHSRPFLKVAGMQ